MSEKLLRFGIVGIGGRPMAFLSAFEKSGKAKLAAVCDIDREIMDKNTEGIDGVLKFTDYEEMLDKADLDAVIVGTPIHLHVTQSIAALKRNIHVFSEVTAGITLEECKELVEACKASKAQYMLGENCNFLRSNMIVENMVKNGLFGSLCYAEGEYNHDCRNLIPKTPWRKKYVFDVAGVTYGTHSLGPILSWLENDRVTSVCCASSNSATTTLEGEPLLAGTCHTMLCKTAQGRLIKIKNNMLSPRPYGLNYTLEGSNAAFQSFRLEDQVDNPDYIWFNGKSPKTKWEDISLYEEGFVPEIWQKHSGENNAKGHEGADVITMIAFIDAIYDGKKVPIGIHKAMDMTLPGLISQLSVKQNGAWLEVPNSREW